MKFNKLIQLPPRAGGMLYIAFILMLSLFGFSHGAHAVVNCGFSSTYPPNSLTATVNVSAYVGNELPVGSTIYRATLIPLGKYFGVTCNGSYSLPVQLSVTNKPSGPSFPFSGTNYGSGPVFPTNVSGVGFAIWSAGQLSSDTNPITLVTMNNNAVSANYDFSLIKTGPIASGSVVNASSFPTVVVMVPATAGYTGLPLILQTVNITGSINFTTSTCTTPDVNVNMGTYDIPTNFHQVGSVTPWVDASITLQDCPMFSGRFGDQGTAQAVPGGGGIAAGTARKPSLLTVSLTPMSSIVDTANGVIAVDSGQGPDLVARGVGLQLGYTPTDMNASATAPTTIWKPGISWDMQPANDGRNSFKIPLAARYYQTNSHVTAGPANTKVVFNIDYK
jgi:type 1 fimbria pilin